jgi:hypothetical protein
LSTHEKRYKGIGLGEKEETSAYPSSLPQNSIILVGEESVLQREYCKEIKEKKG